MRWPASSSLSSLSRHLRSILRACARHSSIEAGQKVHAAVVTSGLAVSPNYFLRNALLHLYAACGSSSRARKVFDQIPQSHRDAYDWTALIGCFARSALPSDALRLFNEMLRTEGVRPDEVTMVCLFSACARVTDAGTGAAVHALMVKMGLGFGVSSCNAAMDMYVKCGLMRETRRVFEDIKEKSVVSWTVILEGVVKWEGVENGRLLFDQMPQRNEVAWTIVIVGYLESGFTQDGLLLLNEMVSGQGYVLNHVTLCSILSACSMSGNLTAGKLIHLYALKIKGEANIDIMVGTALIDMYAKCGRINTALTIFNKMPRRNVVAWSVMINGLAMHGRGTDALNIFPEMVKEVEPDDITLSSLLSVCSHAGLVDQGWHYFHEFQSVYGITPKVEHYACMVDLLGRAGHFQEAEALVTKMPIAPNEFVLGSLIGACSIHGKLQLGERLLKELIEMDPLNREYHVLLSNMNVLAGNTRESNSLRWGLRKIGSKKVPGLSSIHIRGEVQ